MDRKKDQDRMWAATRLTEVAVTQLFQGASTPTDAKRGQEIGLVVAELYAAIYAGQDVQEAVDARTSIVERLADVPHRPKPATENEPRILPRRTSIGPAGSRIQHLGAEPGPGSSESTGPEPAGPSNSGSFPTGALPDGIREEALTHPQPLSPEALSPFEAQDWTEAPAEVPEIGESSETTLDDSQDSLQSLLSEIREDEPQGVTSEVGMARQPEPLAYQENIQAESLESQLAALASQAPTEPEIYPSDPSPLPSETISTAPAPTPVNSKVVVLEAQEKRRSKWLFWRR